MTAHVPLIAPLPARTGVVIADPVKAAGEWYRYGMLSNYLLGRGCTLIAPYAVTITVAAAATATIRHSIWPRYQATHRVWTIGMYSTTSDVAVVTFTDPSGGTHEVRPSTVGEGVYDFVETISARTSSNVDVSISIAALVGAGSVVVTSIGCFEVPRPELALDANDQGVDLDTLFGGRPIYDGARQSIGAAAAGISAARTIATRSSLFHWGVNEANARSISGTLFLPLFRDGGAPILLDRKLYNGETVRTINVKAWMEQNLIGGGDTLELRFTMASGDTLTLSQPGLVGSWVSGSLDVHVEDPTSSDGSRSSTFDKCTIEARMTVGSNTAHVDSIAISGTS